MIQRIQSLWLLLAAVFAFLTFRLPFYSGNKLTKEGIIQPEVSNLDSGSQIFLLILASVVIILSFAALVMYKKRKQQLNLTIVNIIFSIVLVVVYFLEISKYDKGVLSLSCLFTLAIPVFLFFAARGIWKDEKLIKSLDRLR